MAENSAIEWTDAVWNPTTGCTRVSPGCKNCYAFQLHDMRHAAFLAGKKLPQQYAKPFKELQLFEDRLTLPLKWRKPKRIFVNSMSDLFHKDVPDSFIDKVLAAMFLAKQHTFQVLTKRPERMARYFAENPFADVTTRLLQEYDSGPYNERPDELLHRFQAYVRTVDHLGYKPDLWPLPNVWLGTSVERQEESDERIPHLLRTPAAVRFLSCEPLLSVVDLTRLWLSDRSGWWNALDGRLTIKAKTDAGQEFWCETEQPIAGRIDWCIVGGESGRAPRPCDLAWLRSLVTQCKAAAVPVFVKQLGSNATANYYDEFREEWESNRGNDWPEALDWNRRDGQPPLTARVALPMAKKGRDLDDFPRDLRIREFPGVRA